MFELMPFERRANNLWNMFDSMEREMMDLKSPIGSIRTDISEQDGKYLIEAELPGFKKEDIQIDITGKTLSISAAHNEETEDKSKGYLRKERRFGSFRRTFDLTGVDAAAISADYKDGVLILTLPKLEQQPESTRRIELT